MLEILTSKECLAAFLGAFSAFLLEALRRWHVGRGKDLSAGNETIFTLAQYYTVLRSIYKQGFEDRAERVRKATGQEPNYLQYGPMGTSWSPTLRVPLDRVGYLLSSYAPDILDRVAMAERDALGLLAMLDRRNALHIEFQRRAAEIRSIKGSDLPIEELEEKISRDVLVQLRQLTEALQSRMPECWCHLKIVADQVGDVLAYHFPTSHPARFGEAVEPFEPFSRPLAEPPRWRRLVRWANRPLRCKRKAAAPTSP